MICQECKAEVQGAPKFCPKCGAKVGATAQPPSGKKVCPQCGAENSPSAKFCKSDGYRFPDAAEAAPGGRAIQPVAPPLPNPAAPAPTAPVGKDLSSVAPASSPDVSESSRAPHVSVAKERLASTGEARPVSVARSPGVEGAVPHRGGTEAHKHVPAGARSGVLPDTGGELQASAAATTTKVLSTLRDSVPVALQDTVVRGAKRQIKNLVISKLAIVGVICVVVAAGLLFGVRQFSTTSNPDGEGQAASAKAVQSGAKSVPPPVPSSAVTEKLAEARTCLQRGDPVCARSAVQTALEAEPQNSEGNRLLEEIAKAETKSLATDAADRGRQVAIASAKQDSAVVSSSGAVREQDVPREATTVVPVPPEARSEPPAIDAAAVQRGVIGQLRKGGLESISARVDAEGNATLQGTVTSAKDKDRAIRLALAQTGVTGVNDSIRVVAPAPPPAPPPVAMKQEPSPSPVAARPDPAKLEGEINRALRSGGAGGVTADVGNDFSVTLKGSATSAAQKDRAFQIARQFRNVANLKDRVFVVEQ